MGEQDAADQLGAFDCEVTQAVPSGPHSATRTILSKGPHPTLPLYGREELDRLVLLG